MRKIPVGHYAFAVLLLLAVIARFAFASEPARPAGEVPGAPGIAESNPADSSAHDPVAAEYERLGKEFERLDAAREVALPFDSNEPADLTLSDDEWLKQRREAQAKAPNPDALLPQFVEFAKNHPNSPLAFDAVFFVVRKSVFQEFRADGKPSPVLAEALDIAWDDHKDDPRLVHLLELLAIPTRPSEAFLKRAMGDAPNRTVRAAATFYLGRYYWFVDGCYIKTHRVADKRNTTPTNEDRRWKLVVVPNLEKYLPLDRDENAKRIDALFNQVVADFSDVPAAGWRTPGPGNIYVQTVPSDPSKTYGDEAAAMLYEMKHLTPGNPAPETVGQDADGKTFRLSDYRGQVVLLTFSADWCPGCVERYPIQRHLQEKFRGQPFVILSVSCDESVETVKSSIAAGKITWRCWWDGRRGPVGTAWNADAGSVFLLDHNHVIQDIGHVRRNTAEEFEQAIAPLVEQASAQKRTEISHPGATGSASARAATSEP
jgi:thiol-disulfide isomerase/thioredoxin